VRRVVARIARAVAAGLLLAGCATSGPPVREASITWGDYRPDRRDYAAFREAWPWILEPNYLPFMVHRVPLADAAGDAMIFCRWSEDRFPLDVHVAPPEIPASLQDEFHPRPPEHYVTAVRAALETWERNLEGLVRFRYVDRPADADVRVALVGEVGPEPEAQVRVLGATPLGGACRVHGWDPDAERMQAGFEVSEFRVFVADESGLLAPDQVERLALHEIGHVLGMSRHSPIPGDLMYAVARDRPLGDVLSNEDVNSFVSLYRLPNGTVFVRTGQAGSAERTRAPAGPPSGAPSLAVAPHVDARFGYELRLPRGWTRIETARGVIAVNGVAWDYDASFQVIVRRYPTIDSYLARHLGAYLGGGRVVEETPLRIHGHPALRLVVRDRIPDLTEHLLFLETGDGRLLIVIADAPSHLYDDYRPWFEAAIGSVELWSDRGQPAE